MTPYKVLKCLFAESCAEVTDTIAASASTGIAYEVAQEEGSLSRHHCISSRYEIVRTSCRFPGTWK